MQWVLEVIYIRCQKAICEGRRNTDKYADADADGVFPQLHPVPRILRMDARCNRIILLTGNAVKWVRRSWVSTRARASIRPGSHAASERRIERKVRSHRVHSAFPELMHS